MIKPNAKLQYYLHSEVGSEGIPVRVDDLDTRDRSDPKFEW